MPKYLTRTTTALGSKEINCFHQIVKLFMLQTKVSPCVFNITLNNFSVPSKPVFFVIKNYLCFALWLILNRELLCNNTLNKITKSQITYFCKHRNKIPKLSISLEQKYPSLLFNIASVTLCVFCYSALIALYYFYNYVINLLHVILFDNPTVQRLNTTSHVPF